MQLRMCVRYSFAAGLSFGTDPAFSAHSRDNKFSQAKVVLWLQDSVLNHASPFPVPHLTHSDPGWTYRLATPLGVRP